MVRNSGENRRKYLRVESSHTITLLKIFNSGKLVNSLTSGSKTIDLSKGGMRLEIEKPLTSDATVQFSLDNSFPPALRQLTGLVEWCNKQVDEPGYQAGVSFQGEHIVEAMDRYLGQLNQNM